MLLKLFHYLIPTVALWMADGDGGSDPAKDAGTGGATEDKKSFTQAELDSMFADRAKQAGQSAIGKLLQDLGLSKPDELKTLVKTAKDAEAARLSDLEKAQKERDDLRAESEKAKAEAAQAVTLANTRLLEALVIAEASNPEHKFKPEAIRDVWAFVDRSKLAIAEDGTVTGVADVVKAVAKAKPYMVQAEAAKTPAGPGTPPRQRTAGQQPQTNPNGNVPEQTYEQPLVRL